MSDAAIEFCPERVSYRVLKRDDLDEVRLLHGEWFPLDYSDKYFEKALRDTVVAIGCFYIVDYGDFDDNGKPILEELMIGTIMTRIEQNKTIIVDMVYEKNIEEETLRDYFNSCSCKPTYGAYIMTLGVVDEFRRFGLATKMLNLTLDFVRKVYPQC